MAYDATPPEPPAREDRVSTILRSARKMVEDGWCQYPGNVVKSHQLTLRCAVVALVDAGSHERYRVPGHGLSWAYSSDLVDEAIRRLGFQGHDDHDSRFDLMTWNDEPGRTQTEVLQRFDRALEAVSAV